MSENARGNVIRSVIVPRAKELGSRPAAKPPRCQASSAHGHHRAVAVAAVRLRDPKEPTRPGAVPHLVSLELLAVRHLVGRHRLAVRTDPAAQAKDKGSRRRVGARHGQATTLKQLQFRPARGELHRPRAGHRPVMLPMLAVAAGTQTGASKLAMRQATLRVPNHQRWQWTWRTQNCW